MSLNRRNISLVIRSLVVVTAIVILKLILHQYSIEFITINNLFSGIVAANVFLIGFLLSGILSDYKESEKIPGDIAVHISVLYDEVGTLSANDNELSGIIKIHIKTTLSSILDWFHRKTKTNDILDKLEEINSLVSKYDGKVQPNYIIRLKQEIANLKRLVI